LKIISKIFVILSYHW